ncbi:hypothetical protein [Haladaptatus sp. NG-WS-4]
MTKINNYSGRVEFDGHEDAVIRRPPGLSDARRYQLQSERLTEGCGR